MLKSNIARIAALAAVTSQALANVNCNGNITIRVLSELEEVRDECDTVGGDLILAANLTGHANLDGIRRVTGYLDLFSCNRSRGSNCTIEDGATASVSSSTLEEVGGYMGMDTPLAIEKVLFPRLRKVAGAIFLRDRGHLEELDISNLTEAGELNLEDASKLETLNITNLATVGSIYVQGTSELKRIVSNGIKNFTRVDDDYGSHSESSISIWNCEKLEEVGDLFASTLASERGGSGLRLGDDPAKPPKINNITIGWTNITKISADLSDFHIRFGNNETESTRIEAVHGWPSIHFDRGDNLKNLSVGMLLLETPLSNSVEDTTQQTIELPFDQLGELTVRATSSVESISLPERARDWGLQNLTLSMDRTKFLTRDDDDNVIWHWPEDMRDVRITGQIEQDLLELFIEGDRKVSGFFAVTSTNDGIDCEGVREEMEARVGGVFDCYSSDRGYDDAAGALAAHVFHSLGFAVMAGLFLCF